MWGGGESRREGVGWGGEGGGEVVEYEEDEEEG